MATGYILGESKGETDRLLAQERTDPALGRLLRAGLVPGLTVVDAGCGPGLVSRLIAREVGPTGRVIGFDLSEERLTAARALPVDPDAAPMEFLAGNVLAPPVAAGTADLVWCQYVLEYLPDPLAAVRALAGLLKPGGRLVLADIDGLGLWHWPESPQLAADLALFRAMLARTGFDPLIGRKLFGLCRAVGLDDVTAVVEPCVTIAGKAGDMERSAWVQRFVALRPLGVAAFGDSARYDAFTGAFLALLDDPDAFTYWVIVVAHGRKR